MTQQIADVVLVMGLRTDSQRQAFHGQQVLRLGHHDPQVIELEEQAEFAVLAQETLLVRRGIVRKERLLELLAVTPVSPVVSKRIQTDINRDFAEANPDNA